MQPIADELGLTKTAALKRFSRLGQAVKEWKRLRKGLKKSDDAQDNTEKDEAYDTHVSEDEHL